MLDASAAAVAVVLKPSGGCGTHLMYVTAHVLANLAGVASALKAFFVFVA